MISQLYIFLIWEKSLNKKDVILEDIEKKYTIRDIYEIQWGKKEFGKNLKRFYGSSLPNTSQKAVLCGDGSFLLVIITDPHPKLEKKALDDVNEVEINTKVYNSKMEYRRWIGVDFALHASNSEKESNHDLILLLGKNVQDLEKELPEKWDGLIKKVKSNLIGHDGWKDLKQFFDVLNMTSNYVVLRNFDELPYKIAHHDIDILTDDVKNISNLINEDESAVGKASIKVGDKKILVDFRYQEGHHYDEKWAKDVLKRRVMHSNGFYVPCKEDYFFTLLYHAIGPKQIRDDYKTELRKLASEIHINENILDDFQQTKKFLGKYMSKRGYHKTTIDRRILYKLRHSEFMRLVKVSIFLTKSYGIRFLFKKIKIKLNMLRKVNNV